MVGKRISGFFFSFVTVAIMVSAIPAAEVLFVGGSLEPTSGDDELVFARLVDNLGHSVTYLAASEATTEDGEGVDLVVLSSTSRPSSVRGKYPDIETPILQWEEALIRTNLGNFNMADDSGDGSRAPNDTIDIRDPDHPIVQLAGLAAGEVTVYDDFNNLVWAKDLSSDTVGIASNGEHRVLWVLSAIEAGGELSDGELAAGARVNFFIGDTGFSSLTDDGLALFDASVAWLLSEKVNELQAGDADQDLDFDQFDLVMVQIANKYLSGQAATWGEGDWNGAPGGDQGNPPPGNGMFDQLDIIAALNAGVYLTGPYGSLKQGGSEGDGQTSLVYDPASGELKVDAPAGTDLTSINVTSAGGKFIGEKPDALDGAFENFAGDNIFKATFGGSFGSLNFGPVAQAGLTEEFVLNDLTVVGSLAGGGSLGDVDLVYLPEPSCLGLLALGIASLAMIILRRSR